MRTIPGMTIINPADDVEAKAAVEAAINIDGPVYLRFGRLAVPVFKTGQHSVTASATAEPSPPITLCSSAVTITPVSFAALQMMSLSSFGRLVVPVFNEKDTYKFEVGKGVQLKDGKDVTIVAFKKHRNKHCSCNYS